ncbi:Uncharacterised protein [uncultured archaeon]|nr:Uncharacterised protein [uncultured archaeon]
MEFNEIKEKVVKNATNYGKNYKIKIDEDFAVLKLFEEVGEFAQAVLVHKKKCRPQKFISEEKSKENLGEELADILGMVLVNSSLFNIDLEKEISKKWFDKEN